jgi:hypothetical protein
MSFTLMRKAITLFRHADTTRATQRHLQRQWLRSMKMLGDKHCLAKPSPRKTDADDRILQRESYMRFLRADGHANSNNRSTPERE